jgi:hypothetical protein
MQQHIYSERSPMSESYPAYTDELRHDLHGETVGLVHTTPILVCDYCNALIDTTEPIMYEAIRIADMPTVANACDPPEDWFLDAARCRDCEIKQLDPATKGYDEALCILAVSETDGIQSVDASTLAVVDLSPTGNGYAPPVTEVFPLIAADDPGYLRWLRMDAHLAEIDTTTPPEAGELLRDALSDATDIPPGIDV